MTRKALTLALLVAALAAGFAAGHHRSAASAGAARQPLYYVDSMHPSFRSDKPGIAPDCGMPLTPVYAEDLRGGAASAAGELPAGTLRIDPATQQMYGIQLVPVRTASGQDTLHLFGRVSADETRVFRVNFGTDGYVKETHGDAVGTRVQRDQHLATVYSPEFLSVAGGYLSANERAPAAGSGMRDNTAPTANAASAQARADRLRNLGMSDAQITELSRSRKIPEDVYVVAPANGFIMARNLSPGLRFERHTDLYTIADLSHVWILAQVSGRDAHALRPGTVARVTLPDTGESLRARVSNVLPEIDPVSHTLTVRLDAANPSFRLRPDMVVDVELPVAHSAALTVPAEAVLDSGLRKRVYVQTAAGSFQPREVQTGWHLADQVQITAGLAEGEMVASAGTFLIDSESRLQQPAAGAGAHRLNVAEQHPGDPTPAELHR